MCVQGITVGSQAVAPWNLTDHSITALPPVLLPSSILQHAFQKCYFSFYTSLQLQRMKVRDLKLRKAGSVCTSFMVLTVTEKPEGCFVLIHSLMQTVTILVFWLQSCVRPFTQMW